MTIVWHLTSEPYGIWLQQRCVPALLFGHFRGLTRAGQYACAWHDMTPARSEEDRFQTTYRTCWSNRVFQCDSSTFFEGTPVLHQQYHIVTHLFMLVECCCCTSDVAFTAASSDPYPVIFIGTTRGIALHSTCRLNAPFRAAAEGSVVGRGVNHSPPYRDTRFEPYPRVGCASST